MIIQCQSCSTKFRVGDEKVKPPGIKVRCSKCGEVFFYEFSVDGGNGQSEASTLEQPSVNENNSLNELTAEPEESQETVENTEEPDIQAEVADQEETVINQEPEPAPSETDSIDYSVEEIENKEVEAIDTQPQTPDEEDDLSRLSKEIMAAQIGTNLTEEEEGSDEAESSDDFNIDNLDELSQETITQDEAVKDIDEAVKDIMEQQHQDSVQESAFTPPTSPSSPSPGEQEGNAGGELRGSTLVVDQDVLEQTHSKGTVASAQDAEAYHIKSSATSRARRYPRKSKSGGFFKSFFKFVLTVIFLGALFFSSMYILNETEIYPNNYYNKFSVISGNLLGEDNNVDKNKVKVLDLNGEWFNSKYGQVYVVTGDIINRSDESINFVKLKVNYISDGNKIFSQDVYAGNTISDWEIRNKPFNAIQTKLLRKKGDIIYEDVNNLDGLNFDIQPGEEVPFFSVFPAQDKILGLKYRVEVMDYESSKVSNKP